MISGWAKKMLVNQISNVIILSFCLWAILDKRVRCRFFGAIFLSLVGMAAIINLARHDILPTPINVVLAVLAIWLKFKWKPSRHLFTDRK